MEAKHVKTVYNAFGIVLGNCWGGDKCTYEATKLNGFDSIDSLFEEINKRLKDGSLDSGMGFVNLIGAIFDINEIETIECNEKRYTNVNTLTEFFGKMSKEEREFLEDCFYTL